MAKTVYTKNQGAKTLRPKKNKMQIFLKQKIWIPKIKVQKNPSLQNQLQ
jgi:hypothetical protein